MLSRLARRIALFLIEHIIIDDRKEGQYPVSPVRVVCS